jgi:hypothetical protein
MNDHTPITIRELYPDFTNEQLAEAETTFRRYIAVMVRIYERVRAEQGPEAATRLAHDDLTTPQGSANVPVERSKPTLTKYEIQ